ncbi:MAG: hypothetical protein V4697_00605 [Patescibacteria group bacterium]
METKFQTSFIPKKPIVADQKIRKSGGTSVFMFLATLIFIASIAGAVFSVIWKGVLLQAQESYKERLVESEKRFNTNLIEELKKANTKIDLGKQLLKNHLAVSEVFGIISRLTIEGVQFESFDFSGAAKDGEGLKISMKGKGNSFSAIAFQSDVFGQSQRYGSNKILKNPVLSDLNLDDKGNVGFTFTTSIDPTDISYEKILQGVLESEGSISTGQ